MSGKCNFGRDLYLTKTYCRGWDCSSWAWILTTLLWKLMGTFSSVRSYWWWHSLVTIWSFAGRYNSIPFHIPVVRWAMLARCEGWWHRIWRTWMHQLRFWICCSYCTVQWDRWSMPSHISQLFMCCIWVVSLTKWPKRRTDFSLCRMRWNNSG